MTLTPFRTIIALAEERKGGAQGLAQAVGAHKPLSTKKLAALPDDRYLSMMTKCVFQAGFNWKVIERKWADFEAAFHGFNPKGLAHLPPEQWDAYTSDTRIVRNPTKIRAVLDNAHFVWNTAETYGSFGAHFAAWPASDQIGLMVWLKKEGARLGGNTGMYFLRFIGKDSFIISADVTARLQASGLTIATIPSSKRDLRQVQDAFNQWHDETGLSYTALSRIAACSIGPNYLSD
ncbi:MAG: DNA-3-methyladenine glycosylase I [Pseudomonadales bacterium]|jgi:3-methyladenine DNA glycosylase Tag|nr:DNA-3-methyladenine glycosylase I [Pseudomonadales bacterium]